MIDKNQDKSIANTEYKDRFNYIDIYLKNMV